jgi:predicted ATP-dependent endonuclease of OLD family
MSTAAAEVYERERLTHHAKAQYDLLEYINEELAPEHQVIYTTHSPFMLEPSRLHRARMVEDKIDEETEEVLGTKITDKIAETGSEALFPLQAALGFDVVQSLAVGPQILVVEGPSDMMYLAAMSDIAAQLDETPLDHRWTPVPVGGTGQIGNYVSLFGPTSLELAVLIDSDGNSERILSDLDDRGVISDDEIFVLGDIVDETEADIEDLFPEEFFVQLVEDAYRREITLSDPDEIDLDEVDSEHPRITHRIEEFFGLYGINAGHFNHTRPAKQLQRNMDLYVNELSPGDLDNFVNLFEELNEILDT